jgi:hypothetical protein
MSQPDQNNASDADEHYCRLISSLKGTRFAEVWYILSHAGDEASAAPTLLKLGEETGSDPPAIATNH